MPRPTRASAFSTSRSATRSSTPSKSASCSDGESTTSWPAAVSVASTLLPSIRSATASNRAISAFPLDRAALAELFADALRPAPHLHDLGAPLAHLGNGQLAADAFAVQLGQHGLDGLRRRGMAEAVGDEQPPVPIRVAVDLRVDLAQSHGAVDVVGLVLDPQVELEVGPVGRQRLEDALEVIGEGHARKPSGVA